MSVIFEKNRLYQTLVIGDKGVGKSSFAFANANSVLPRDLVNFMHFQQATHTFEANGKPVELAVWVPLTGRAYDCTRRASYKNVHGIFIVYDVTKRESFNHLQSWLTEIQQWNGGNAQKVIIGMKNDLVNQRGVSFQEAKQYAASLNIPMFEVSAHEHDFIDIIFKTMISYIQPDIHLTLIRIRSEHSVAVERNMQDQGHQNAAEGEHAHREIGIDDVPPVVKSCDIDDGEMERAILDLPTEDKKNN
ncbi:unnamed protein product [Adineta ricciae]|uniref:Uncharacterized protein n=1 Tax=Adineta ricciae TaxID=249248 RepID=A0A814W4C1_ADIRI|nr:unnamed protein product [Adineta ricciae]